MDFEKLKINLTQDEKEILNRRDGPVMEKVLRTIVFYGEVLDADRLVEITNSGHLVITYAIPGIAPSMEMLDELIDSKMKVEKSFTLDPKPPLDFENWNLKPEQKKLLLQMYADQKEYDKKMLLLGLRDPDACTCTPYLMEVGNIPKRGDILAWSESACVIYANSVLAARTNRNGAIIDLLSNLAGKTPLAGLLTDEGRKADWLIKITTEKLPVPQLLGAAIGEKVLAGVPFIKGLDKFLGSGINSRTRDYLHDMGSVCATAGAVGLYHVENITPEAIDFGTDLITEDFRTYVIGDDELKKPEDYISGKSEGRTPKPEKCYLGCPHFSLEQLSWWSQKIDEGLKRSGQKEIPVKTTVCAAPQILKKFKKSKAFLMLEKAGVKFSFGCPLFDELGEGESIITNSYKLHTYTSAQFYPDDILLSMLFNQKS